jgi:hypothetical protein
MLVNLRHHQILILILVVLMLIYHQLGPIRLYYLQALVEVVLQEHLAQVEVVVLQEHLAQVGVVVLRVIAEVVEHQVLLVLQGQVV